MKINTLQPSVRHAFRRGLLAATIVPLMIMGLFLVISWWQLNSALATVQLIEHSDQVIAQTHVVQELLVDMETGLRGYLLTGNQVFLAPYQNGVTNINSAFDALEHLITDNPTQLDRLRILRSQWGDWQKFAQETLTVKAAGNTSSVDDQLQGKQLMDQLRMQVSSIIDSETMLRTAHVDTAQKITQEILAVGFILTLVLGILLILFIRSQFSDLSHRFEDVLTEATQQAEDARTQREWLQGTLASIGDGVIATDTRGNITFINRVAQALTNWSPDEIRGKPLATVLNIVKETTREPITSAALTPVGAPPDGNLTTETRDRLLLIGNGGRETPIENSAAPIRNSHNAIVGSVFVFRDLTERRRFDLRLISTERRYRDLTNAMPLMLWTATATGEVDYYNRQWFEYTGLSHEQSKSVADWQSALHPDDVERTFEQWNEALKTGQPYEIEYRWKRVSDGAFLWHLGRAIPITNDGGEVTSWVGTLTNIDKQKQSETALLERSAELELSTQRLEERNQELDQFAYVTSHDLKAPLRGIANLSQWIEEDLGDKVNDEVHKQMELLRGRVHRMEGLIDGILQYSRVGRVKGSIETVNVEVFLKEIVDLLAPPPDFTVIIEPGMPVLRAERLMLQQVFSNLIGNAIKHRQAPNGHVTVGIKDQSAFYEFTVADDGPGIAPEYHQKIFVIFQTLESRDKVEGSGLGLALVKKIVEHQGGKIWVESQVGIGTTFHFTWPKRVRER